MTLIIATITPRGAVLAADQRVTGTHKSTGQKVLIRDDEQKIAIHADVAVAHQGTQSVNGQSVTEVTHDWLKQYYNPAKSLTEQIAALRQYIDAQVTGVGLVAVRSQDRRHEIIRHVGEQIEYKQMRPNDLFRMTISGTGSDFVRVVLDQMKPQLQDFDLKRLANLSHFLIQATHGMLLFHSDTLAGVGQHVTVATIDKDGACYDFVDSVHHSRS